MLTLAKEQEKVRSAPSTSAKFPVPQLPPFFCLRTPRMLFIFAMRRAFALYC